MLACLYRNPFGRFSFSISSVFFCCFHPSSNFLTFFPLIQPFGLFVVSFLFLRRVYRVLCFILSSLFFFYVSCHRYDFFPLFVVHLCVCEVCVFRLTLLCFLTRGVQMPNDIISVCTASVPVILFTVGHY